MSLSKYFNPEFDSKESIIKIDHFKKKWKILHIRCCILKDFPRQVFKYLLNWIGNFEYWDKWDNSTLSDQDKIDIKKTLWDSKFKDKKWLFAEYLLRDFRSKNIINSFWKPHFKEWLKGTTQPGEDFFEIIIEDTNILWIMRDARNDSKNWIEALKSKIRKLYTIKNNSCRSIHKSSIENLYNANYEIIDDTTKKKLYQKIDNIHNERKHTIFLVTEDKIDDTHTFDQDYIKRLLKKAISSENKELYKEMIDTWIYDAYYVIIEIPWYKKFSEEIINLFDTRDK